MSQPITTTVLAKLAGISRREALYLIEQGHMPGLKAVGSGKKRTFTRDRAIAALVLFSLYRQGVKAPAAEEMTKLAIKDRKKHGSWPDEIHFADQEIYRTYRSPRNLDEPMSKSPQNDDATEEVPLAVIGVNIQALRLAVDSSRQDSNSKEE